MTCVCFMQRTYKKYIYNVAPSHPQSDPNSLTLAKGLRLRNLFPLCVSYV